MQLILDLLLPEAKQADRDETMVRIERCFKEALPLLFVPNDKAMGPGGVTHYMLGEEMTPDGNMPRALALFSALLIAAGDASSLALFPFPFLF